MSAPRLLGRTLGRLTGYLASIDTDRLLAAGFALGVVLAVAIVALAGFLPGGGGGVAALLHLFALLLPACGLVFLVIAAHRQVRSRSPEPDPIRSPPPEEGVTEADRPVGRETERDLTEETSRRYRCRSPSSVLSRDTRDSLRRAAVRLTRTRRGHDDETARSIVNTGEWTDDPVAAAFLSGETRYPITERLRAAIDPGRAYRRRVRRTLDAITSQQPDTTAGSAGTAGHGVAHSGSESPGDRPSGGESPGDLPSGGESPGNLPSGDRPSGETTVTVERTVSRDTGWAVAVAVAIAGVGLVVASPVLVAAATVPLWYAAAASLTGRPAASVSVARSLHLDGDAGSEATSGESLSGDPGDVVTVRTTVRNDGSGPAVDLRFVDGVPEALPVVEGSPRACVTLGPGEETTIEYGVELQRGEHAFAATALRVRDLAGVTRVDASVRASGATTLRCSPAVDRAPVGSGRNDHAGEVPTDEGGSGVEFHSVRDYEPGDPVRSIDWRRYANTRDLATVEYRAERSTRILCVVDARPSQFRAPVGSTLSTVELCADAAERTVGRLLQEGHPTGTAAVYDGQVALVAPGTGTAVRERAIELLETVPEADRISHSAARRLRDDPDVALPRTLQGETRIFLFSSLVDDDPVDLVEQLRSRGYGVCVVSPDVTGSPGNGAVRTEREANGDPAGLEPLSRRLAGLEREARLARARTAGAAVVEWDLDQPLGVVLDRAVVEVGP